VPSECRHDGIYTLIKPSGKEGERAPIRGASKADHRIVTLLRDLGPARGKINKLPGVCSLVRGIV
jgi:hypothetical protein